MNTAMNNELPVFIYRNPRQQAFSYHWSLLVWVLHAGCGRRKSYGWFLCLLASLSTACSGRDLGTPRRRSLGLSLWGRDLLTCCLGTSKRDSQARMICSSYQLAGTWCSLWTRVRPLALTLNWLETLPSRQGSEGRSGCDREPLDLVLYFMECWVISTVQKTAEGLRRQPNSFSSANMLLHKTRVQFNSASLQES